MPRSQTKAKDSFTDKEVLRWLKGLLDKHKDSRFTGTLHIKFREGVLSRAWRRYRSE